ncbi:hypothetical protein PVAP13_2NG088192 [Panicum virgatum]|uniref:Uncharacterized protein n=1 Tax=Panicum virgatum TaxID=38727 RepID=A0A8T0V7P3_PANVG|nr:hypothetical protein PVAP13_2NG088192 [Panicum virgatum]
MSLRAPPASYPCGHWRCSAGPRWRSLSRPRHSRPPHWPPCVSPPAPGSHGSSSVNPGAAPQALLPNLLQHMAPLPFPCPFLLKAQDGSSSPWCAVASSGVQALSNTDPMTCRGATSLDLVEHCIWQVCELSPKTGRHT